MKAVEANRTRKIRLAIVVFKFLTGTAEAIAGLLLILLPPSFLRILFDLASAQEIREDPGDRLVPFIQDRLPQLLGTKLSIAIGLMALGVVKMVGSVGLYRRKPWGYYLLVILLFGLLPFDAVHVVSKMSVPSLGLFLANVLVLGLLLLFRKTLVAREERFDI